MPHHSTFTALALLAAGGTFSGVWLGKSAVAEIDPVHYSTAVPSRFYSDMVPGAGGANSDARSTADFAGLGDGCVNCRTYPEEYVPQHDGSADAYQAAYPAVEPIPVDPLIAEVDRQIEQMQRSAAVTRYAGFAVEEGRAGNADHGRPLDTPVFEPRDSAETILAVTEVETPGI